MLNTECGKNAVLVATPWCVIREQAERFLIYNIRTDELHLVTRTGMYAYQLCDGLRPIGEICANFESSETKAQTRSRMMSCNISLLLLAGVALGVTVMYEHRHAPSFRAQFPLHMVWLATNACNARCLHCSSASSKRMPDELRTEEVYNLIDQLANCGVVDFAISGGEPLLRRNIFRIIAHAKSRRLSVGLGSNGAKFGREQAKELADAGLDRLQISLDGLEPIYDELRRWPGLFGRAVAAIATAQEVGVRTHVCMTINKLNSDQLEVVAHFVASLGVTRMNVSRFVPTGRGADTIDLPDHAWEGIVRRVQALKESLRFRMDLTTHLAQQVLVDPDAAATPCFAGCQAGSGQGCVTANGTVLPCVLLPVPLGNIRHRQFAELWAELQVIQSSRTRHQLSGRCGACLYRERLVYVVPSLPGQEHHGGGSSLLASLNLQNWTMSRPSYERRKYHG